MLTQINFVLRQNIALPFYFAQNRKSTRAHGKAMNVMIERKNQSNTSRPESKCPLFYRKKKNIQRMKQTNDNEAGFHVPFVLFK